VLFKKDILHGIAVGRVTRAFRHWRKPPVRAGSTLRTPIGVLAIQSVRPSSVGSITQAQARQAGYASRDLLCRALAQWPNGQLFHITFHLMGADPRIARRQQTKISAADRLTLDRQLARWDRSHPRGAWTQAFLNAVQRHPGERAAVLAQAVGWPKEAFKITIRKLKELGFTESLGTGYRLAPRGRAYLSRKSKMQRD